MKTKAIKPNDDNDPLFLVNIGDTLPDNEARMVLQLRLCLRDNAPDREYQFKPTRVGDHVDTVQRLFGFVWTDSELLRYFQWSIEQWNMSHEKGSPRTMSGLVNDIQSSCSRIIMGTAINAIFASSVDHALFALSVNSVHNGDEFVSISLPDGRNVKIPTVDLRELAEDPTWRMKKWNSKLNLIKL